MGVGKPPKGASANTDEVCPGCKHPRMMRARSIPRAAVLDTTEDGALPRKMMRAMRRAVPTWHSRLHQGCGSDRANLRPGISAAEPPWCFIWALTILTGEGECRETQKTLSVVLMSEPR